MGIHSQFVVAKTGKKYWIDKVYRPVSVRSGGKERIESPIFAVKLQHGGKRMSLSLGTANQNEAAEFAREMFIYLKANGWEAFLNKYRHTERDNPEPEVLPKTNVTIGEFLAAVALETDLSERTLRGYIRTFRYIVSQVFAVKAQNSRFAYRASTHRQWHSQIDSIPLSEVTPERIRAWQKSFVALAGRDELARRRATVSVNSYLRQGKALFSRKNVLSKLRSIVLPATLPFDGLSLERRTNTKFYGAGVDPVQLMRWAAQELAVEREQDFRALVLALCFGLRRREIDTLEWDSIDLDAETLRVVPTEYYRLKTQESAAALPIEPELLPLFRGWRAKARSQFVVESDRLPKSVNYQWYRVDFEALLVWLRSKGMQGNKPLHQLRKIYGSRVADLYGLHAASASLRHADLRTTSEFYADRSVKVTSGLASVLSVASIVPSQKEAHQS
jgi:integrase